MPARQVEARRGLVVEEPLSGWVGAVVRVEKTAGSWVVGLEDAVGKVRAFPLDDEFWIDGEAVRLTRGTGVASAHVASGAGGAQAAGGASGASLGDAARTANARGALRLTASGSVAAPQQRAKVARGSRIWVEGRHDAELVEKVWGADLRDVGVVVEMLDGVDHLAERLAEFAPEPGRRVAVLLDHLVAGSKESRLAAAAAAPWPDGAVLVRGHKFVDIWQAVRPARVGLAAWPEIPRTMEWKVGVLAHLGWPRTTQADIAAGWHRILGTVRDYRDLEPSLLASVEELIDFTTAP